MLALNLMAAEAKTVRHYVFFGMDRETLPTAKAFFEMPEFEGAQISYSWRRLEPGKDEYDFRLIREDLELLNSKGKKLFVQIQDVSFSDRWVHVPRYLVRDPEYNGGADRQYQFGPDGELGEAPKPAGWMARRWDPAVRERFRKLLIALGKEFDGKIEGINLAETSCVVGDTGKFFPKGYTHAAYRDGIIANMKALREAFRKSTVIVYANFMPGDWLPTQDRGYLRSVYAAAKVLKVGVGGPDVFPYKPGQMNNSYHLIHDIAEKVPVGMAVQDGNYEHVNPKTNNRVTAREIHDFATGYLRADYIFWGIEEPYFSQQTIPFLSQRSVTPKTR